MHPPVVAAAIAAAGSACPFTIIQRVSVVGAAVDVAFEAPPGEEKRIMRSVHGTHEAAVAKAEEIMRMYPGVFYSFRTGDGDLTCAIALSAIHGLTVDDDDATLCVYFEHGRMNRIGFMDAASAKAAEALIRARRAHVGVLLSPSV